MSSTSTSSGTRDHLDELMQRMQQRSISKSELMQLRAHAATCEACALLLELGPKLAEAVAPRESDVFLDQRVVSRALGRARAGRRGRAALVLAVSAAAMLVGSVAAARYFGAWPARAEAPAEAPAARAPSSARAVSAPLPPAQAHQEVEAAGPALPAVSADPASASAPRPNESAAELFASANQLRRIGQDAAAVAAYRGLQQRYPSSPEARLSRATLGTLLLQRGDASGALQQFDGYIQVGGPVLEEALAGRARALGVLGDVRAEARAWQTLLERFPGSVHAARARTRLAELR